jgi:hypothetical protein
VYYELDNFYQNHRTYVKSRSDKQLLGEDVDDTDLADCAPRKSKRVNGDKKTLWPCGLVATSLFDDIFTLNTTDLSMSERGIAWDTDVMNKFANPDAFATADVACADIATCINKTVCEDTICTDNGISQKNCRGYQCAGGDFDYSKKDGTSCDSGSCKLFYYPDDGNGDNDKYQYLYEEFPHIVSPIVGITNEHFIVWMRTAGLPKFRKLYGRIDQGIPAGTDVTFQVTNNFPVSDFKGKKTLVITTLSWVGGKNPFLGIAYVVVGVMCVVLALLFGIKQFLSPRKLGDPRYLQWNDK